MEDPSTKRKIPPGYIETLESRIAYLETLLRDVRPDVSLDHIQGDQILPSIGSDLRQRSPSRATTSSAPLDGYVGNPRASWMICSLYVDMMVGL
jgi:hypothetical protein